MGSEPTQTLRSYRTGEILKIPKPSWKDEVLNSFLGTLAIPDVLVDILRPKCCCRIDMGDLVHLRGGQSRSGSEAAMGNVVLVLGNTTPQEKATHKS